MGIQWWIRLSLLFVHTEVEWPVFSCKRKIIYQVDKTQVNISSGMCCQDQRCADVNCFDKATKVGKKYSLLICCSKNILCSIKCLPRHGGNLVIAAPRELVVVEVDDVIAHNVAFGKRARCRTLTLKATSVIVAIVWAAHARLSMTKSEAEWLKQFLEGMCSFLTFNIYSHSAV